MIKPSLTAACVALSILSGGCGDSPTPPVPLAPPQKLGDPVPLPDDPRRHFDFWLGEWGVVNQRAEPDGSWKQPGVASAKVHSIVDGGAVIEQWLGGADPLIGFSLRAYDEASGRWSVWRSWTRGKPNGFSEMWGQRSGERIELFHPDDPRQLRASFSEARTKSCRWEQATSEDGQTWITDWIMDFIRRGEPLQFDATNAPVTPHHESAENYPETRRLDFLLGAWEGSAYVIAGDGNRIESTARARVTAFNRGLGLLQFLDIADDKTFAALAWDPEVRGWVALHVDSRGGGITRLTGDLVTGGLSFFSPSAGMRQSWSCPEKDVCSWRRETSTDGGATWVTTAVAELARSASTSAWIDIRNARAPFDRVLTGGQPTADQLAWAARNGYRTVVNLRGPGEQGELQDEAALVKDLGLRYVAIPMTNGDDLNAENASRLAQALQVAGALPAMVHCASGNRVGALFGLRAHVSDGLDAEAALKVARSAGITSMEPILKQRLGLPPK